MNRMMFASVPKSDGWSHWLSLKMRIRSMGGMGKPAATTSDVAVVPLAETGNGVAEIMKP